MQTTNKIRFIIQSATIAAIYVVLTLITNLFGLASGVIQVRFSEALTILPAFLPSAVPGLFVGCLISNLLAGGIALDIIFGSLATLIGAVFTHLFRKHKLLAPIPPIISNTVIIPFILAYAYNFEGSVWYFMITVGAGEIISCGILGYALMLALKRFPNKFFK
jgi:uncharacterized membrane protein